MSSLFYIFLFSLFILPEVCVFSQILPYSRIISALIIFTGFIYISLQPQQRRPVYRSDLVKPIKKLLFYWIVLILYILLIDLYREGVYEAIKEFLKYITYLGMFYMLIKTKPDININKRKFDSFILILFLFNLVFGIIQIFDYEFTYAKLLPESPFTILYLDEFTQNFLEAEGRVIGPFIITIGFSAILGLILLYCGNRYLLFQKKFVYLFICIITIVLSFFTFTRSLTFGLIPSMILGYLILNKKWKHGIYILIVSVFFLIFLENVFLPMTHQFDRRSSMVLEGNTAVKILSNVCGVAGVLNKSPLVGVPKEENFTIISEGTRLVRLFALDKFPIVDTNHNQIGWFIKYYGIIGFWFFIAFNIYLFRTILLLNDKFSRYFILTLYIFIMQFSMLHNNLLITDYYFWIFCGLCLIQEIKGKQVALANNHSQLFKYYKGTLT